MFSPPPGALNGVNGSNGTDSANRGVTSYLESLRDDPVLSRLASSFIGAKVTTNLGPEEALSAVVQAERMILLGTPGMGKTTLLKAAAYHAAGLPGGPKPARIPIYVDLAQAREGEGVDETVSRALAGVSPFVSLADCAPALLLIDNLDRASDVYVLEGLELLLRAGGRAGPAVVIASRSGEWPAYRSWFGDVPTVELGPLSPRAVRDTLRRTTALDVAESATQWLSRDRALGAAVARPLTLSAFLQVIQDRDPAEWRRRQVLDALLEAFLSSVPSIERPAYRSALSDVALRSLEAGLPVEVDTVAMALGVTRDDMIRTGAVEGRGAKLTFVEPLLAHHCAASALSRHAANPRKLAELLGDLNDPRRADTLVHVFNLSAEPVDFLAALLPLEGGPEIAARCLAEPDAADPGGPAGAPAIVEGLAADVPPVPVRSLYRLGEALARLGQTPGAEVALRAALLRTEGDVDLDAIFARSDVDDAPPVSDWVRHFIQERNRGIVYRSLPEAGESLAAFDSASNTLGKLDAEVTFERGLAAQEAGDTDAALAAMQQAVAAEPDRARYQFHLGRMLVAVGRADEAIEPLRRARDLAGDHAAIEAAMGEAYLQQNWLEEAINCFERASRLEPEQPAYLQTVGELVAERGDLVAAAERMRQAVAARPDQVAWHDGLGQVLAELDLPREAAEAFRAANALEPERPDILRRLGRALSNAGDHEAALNALRRALALAPDDPATQADLAHGLATAGETEAAIHALRRAIAADDSWPADHMVLAKLLWSAGDLDGALRHAQTAVELAPASVRALTALGQVYEARGETRQAQDLFQRAARRTAKEDAILPDSPSTSEPPAPAAAAPSGLGAPATTGIEGHSDAAPNDDVEQMDSGGASRSGWLSVESLFRRFGMDGGEGQADASTSEATREPHQAQPDTNQIDTSQSVPSQSVPNQSVPNQINTNQSVPNQQTVPNQTDTNQTVPVQGLPTQGHQFETPPAEGDTDLMGVTSAWPAVSAPLDAPESRAGIEALAEAARNAPDDPEALRAYGLALRAAGYADKAIGVLRRAARLSPRQWELLWELARTALILERLNEARYATGAAMELVGEKPALLALKGDVEMASGNPDAATAAYERAHNLDPDNPVYARRVADLSSRHAATQAAAAAASESSPQRIPGAVSSAPMEGTTSTRPSTSPAAQPSASPLGSAPTPASAEMSRRLADLHAQAGDWELAANEYARARAVDPREPTLAAAHGAALRKAGHPDAAIGVLEGVAGANTPEVLAELGAAYADAGREHEALEAYGHAVAAGAGPDTALAWSRAALAVGAMDDAIEGARRAVVARPQGPEAYATLGAAYAASGLPEAALTAVARAASLDPQSVPLRVELGRLAIELHRYDEAVAALEGALTEHPDADPLHHALGNAFRAKGWTAEAAEAYRKAIALAPEQTDYYRSLARLLSSADPDGAAAALRDALEVNPADAATAYELGDLHVRSGDDELARRMFERALKHRPESADYARAFAACLARLGDSEAGAAYERTLELAPEDAGALAGLGAIHADAGRRQDAIRSFEKASRLAPDQADYWRRLGQLYLAEGDAEAAVSAFTEAVRAEPGDAASHRTVGMALEALGRPHEAARAFEQAVHLDPGDTDALVRLGRSRLDAGDAEGAVEVLERALVLDPQNGGAMIVLAEAVRSRGRIDAALGYAKRAVELAADDPAAWHTLAAAARAAGNLDLATRALHEAADLEPGDAGTYRLLAETARDQGDVEAALTSYRDLVVAAPEDVEAAVTFGELVAEGGFVLVPVAPEPPPALDKEMATTAAAVLEAILAHGAPAATAEDGPSPDGGTAAAATAATSTAATSAAATSAGASPQVPSENLPAGSGELPTSADPRTLARAGRALALLRGRLGDTAGALEAAHDAADRWETPRSLVTVAWAQVACGDPAAALEALGLARALEADGADVHLLAAKAHELRGDFSLAAEAYRLAAARAPDLAEAHAGLAAMHAELGRTERALASYRRAVELAPRSAWCRELGQLALECGRLDEALDALEAYTAEHPEVAEPRRDLAMVRFAGGDIEGALRDLSRAVTLGPDRPDWHAELGDLYRGKGNLEQAYEAYRRAAELDPDNATYRLAEARILLEEGHADDARKRIEAALAVNPGNQGALALLGRIHMADGDLASAQDAFAKALDCDPNNPDSHYYLGITAKSLGDLDLALDHLEDAARLNSADARTYVALGELYQQLGSTDDAIQALEQAAVSEQGTIDATMRLGDLCTRLGLVDKALATYQRAAEAAPGDYRPRQGMAHAYMAKHDLEEAVAAFEDAIAKGPRAAEVYFDAGMAYKKLRDYGRAADMFKKATRLAPGSAAAYTQLAAVSALHFLDRSPAGRDVGEGDNHPGAQA